MKKQIAVAAVALLGGVGVLTGCGSGSDSAPQTPSQERTEIPQRSEHTPDADKAAVTRAAMANAWKYASYDDQVETCDRLSKQGFGDSVNKLREASDNSTELDYEYAINIMIGYCVEMQN